MIGSIERMARTALRDGWKVDTFNRHKNDKQCWLNLTYFNLIYGLKGTGIEYSLQDLVSHTRVNLEWSDYGPEAHLLRELHKHSTKIYQTKGPSIDPKRRFI